VAIGTWTWIGNVGSADISSNWTLTAGTSNPSGFPGPGDLAIIGSGSAIYLDPAFINSTTVELNNAGGVHLLNDTTVESNATIDGGSTIVAEGSATAMQVGGPVANSGTIEVVGTNDSLAIAIAANGSIGGLLINTGEISVGQSDTIAVTGTGDFSNGGNFDVNGGSALIASPLTGTGAWSINNGGTLEFAQPNSGATARVDFSSGTGTMTLDNASLFQGSVNGFVVGDKINLGTVTVATAIYSASGQLQLLGADSSILFQGTVVGAGGTLFEAGTFAIGATGGIAGGLRIAQGPGSVAVLGVQGPSTWTWFGGAGSATSAANWSLTSGFGNPAGLPAPTDTELVNSGTLQALDLPLTDVTLVIGNADAQFSNDTASLQAAPFDSATVIESTASAVAAELQSFGVLLNNGTISAAAADGRFALQVQQFVSTTTEPGLFVNNGEITASNGDTLDISSGSNAAFMNISTVLANGGLVQSTGSVASANGIWSISNNGTLEVGAMPSSASVLFADQTGTLKFDTLVGSSARILGFQTGDTIDLGKETVDTIIYDAATSQLTLIDAGTTLGSLSLVSNDFQSGTFAVSGGSAGSFQFTTNSADETLLTTSVQNTSWGKSAGSGDWNTGPNWTHGIPGSDATAVFDPSSSSRTITVSSEVNAGSVLLNDANTTLDVSLALTLARDIDDLDGSVLVTTGAMLTAQSVREDGAAGGTAFDLTSNSATAVLTGAVDPADPSAGPLAIVDSTTVMVNGGLLDAGGQTTADTTGGYVAIGEAAGGPASATMTVQSRGTVFATYTRLASGPTSGGTLSINGAGSRYSDVGDPTDTANTRGEMLVGTGGGTLANINAAVLTLDNSSTLTEASYAQIGVASGSNGTVSVTNGAQWNIGVGAGQPGFLAVGQAGTGDLTIDGGGVAVGGGGTITVAGTSSVVPYAVDIGVSTGATGAVNITGPGASLSGEADIRVGDAGNGSLAVSDNADVHAVLGNLDIGGSDSSANGGDGVVSIATGGSFGVDDNMFVWQGSSISVDATSVLTIGGSSTVAGRLNIDLNHALTGDGVVNASVVDNGSIVASSGSTLEITGSVTGSGAFTIAAATTLRLDAAPAADIPVTFGSGISERLILESPGTAFANQILGLDDGDIIELAGLSIVSANVTTGGTVAVHETGGASYLLSDVGFATDTSQSFVIGHDAATGNDFIQVACFLAGTHIETECGAIPVEALCLGDKVRNLLSRGNNEIIWIGRRHIDCRRHPRPELVRPIRIASGAFGPGLPRRDLYLSPDHSLYLEGILIPVKYLVNGLNIVQTTLDEVTYYHVALPRHDVLLAEGLPTESHLDIADRVNFENSGGVGVLYPDFASRLWEAEACAPLVVTGPQLQAVRRKLKRFALGRRAA
jgi:T5SS/PEP-CTERM-associated repeat protein